MKISLVCEKDTKKRGKMKIMQRRFLSAFLAFLLLIMPVFPVLAQQDTTRDNIEYALTKIDGMTSTLRGTHPDIIPNLINTIKSLDDNNNMLNKVFDAISDTAMEQRLSNVGITKQSMGDAMKIFRDNDGYNKLNTYLADVSANKDTFAAWLEGVFNQAVKDDSAPLKTLDQKVAEKFGGWYNFLNFAYDNQDIVKNNISITYDKNNKTITASSTKAQNIADAINGKIDENHYLISDFNQEDVNSIISAINAFLSSIPASDVSNFAVALADLGYNVTTIPSEGGGTSSGGGGGGGGTAPEKLAVEVPSSPTAPVKVSIPADAAKITEQDGKAVVTFDEGAIKDILKLLDEAASKADGRPTAVSIDLTGSDKIKDNISLVLPKEIVEKAFAKGASIAVNTSAAAVEIPASAFKAEGKPVTFDISIKSPAEVVKGFTLIQGISTVGKAIDLNLKVQDAPAKLDKAVTLRFKLKGIAANIDKLGIYYADTTQKKLEFVGGKVDRQAGEIIATLPHLSAYVLAEYNKTFADITGHWAKNYIESMTAKHVIDGRTGALFEPNDSITRAEFAKIVVNTLGLTLKDYTGAFEDVKPDAWYADYVQTAFEAGLIQGKVEGKTFDPNGKITRQEMMTIIGRTIAKDVTDTSALAAYKDGAKVADYAKAYVSYLISERIIAGYPDMTIKPDASTTRAEAVKIIYGIYNR